MNTLINSTINSIYDIQSSLNENIKNIKNINKDNTKNNNIHEKKINKKPIKQNTNWDINKEIEKSISDFSIEKSKIEDNNSILIMNNIHNLNTIQRYEEEEFDQIHKLKETLEKHQNIFSVFIPKFFFELKKQIKKKLGISFGNQTILVAKDIIKEFQKLNEDMNLLDKQINYSVHYYVLKINKIIDDINVVNQFIQNDLSLEILSGIDKSSELKKLIEQRTQSANELNSIIGSEEISKNNNFIISINNKFNLIDNLKITKIDTISDEFYKNQLTIGLFDSETTKTISLEPIINKGKVGGLLEYRRKILDQAKTKIGQLIVNFVYSLNIQNNIGYDIHDHSGKNFFSNIVPEIKPNKNNQSTQLLLSSWDDSSIAESKKYKLTFLGKNNWKINETSDEQIIDYIKTDIDNNISSIVFDGINITYEKNKLIENDTYMVQTNNNIINKLEIEATPDTKIGLFKNFFDPEDTSYNAQSMTNINNKTIVNHKETLNDAYENYKNMIEHKTAILNLNNNYKESMIDIMKKHEKSKKINSVNINDTYKNINDLHNSYMADSQVLKISNNIFHETMKIIN